MEGILRNSLRDSNLFAADAGPTFINRHSSILRRPSDAYHTTYDWMKVAYGELKVQS